MKKSPKPPVKVVTGKILSRIFIITELIDAMKDCAVKFMEWKIEQERTNQLKMRLEAEREKMRTELTALREQIEFNLKYLKMQREDAKETREAILKTIQSIDEILHKYTSVHLEMIKNGYELDKIKEVGEKITEILGHRLEISRQLTYTPFALKTG